MNNLDSNKRERVGWYFYDVANSAFYTTVISVFLGPYLKSVTLAAADSSGFVHLLGIPIYHESFFFYVLSLSFVAQFFALPILGAIADYTNQKKLLLGVFAYIGSAATMAMYFIEGDNFLFAGAMLLIANVAFGASIVMYNAFLNEISPPDRRDAVSSIGWAFGYLGGGVVLAANLVLYSYFNELGWSESVAVRISMASAGMWWAIFTIIPMITLKVRGSSVGIPKGERMLTVGFKQLVSTVKDAKKYPKTMYFLLAYLCYNEGVQVVIVSAALFGDELGFGTAVNINVILMVQFVAFLGAMIFSKIAKKVGNKNAILLSLIIWTVSVWYGYQFTYSVAQFYTLAASIALVLGGTQALSRSLYSQVIPPGKEAEYFSLYEISDRGTSLIGPFLFGLTLQYTGSFRAALLSLIVFFIIGFVLLLKADIKGAIRASGNELPTNLK